MNHLPREAELGDFTADARMLYLSALAIGLGVCSTLLAGLLLRTIEFFTHVFYFGQFSLGPVSPANNHLGALAVLVPATGGIIIGLMARYGSDKIRGHGIPEAIEAIMLRGSKVEPKLAWLKPLSAAISIGSGGPFGAEGPIIMTGGAFGSLVAQFLHLTSAERKTLLVAGSAAGMSATFAAPLSSIVLAVELLLFEWKPRSFVPVALASVTAAACRRHLLGMGPLFPSQGHPLYLGEAGLLCCAVAGVLAGLTCGLMTRAVYFCEDWFETSGIDPMWRPALGGLVVGVGGLLFPRALGVGYDVIGDLLAGGAGGAMVAGVLLVKFPIWAVALGSGTSGGVLAPLLMTGAAVGGLEAYCFPHEGAGFWQIVSMGAILAGMMRAPLTGVIFSLELTHDFNLTLPLVIAASFAHGFTVLNLKRSILTEKIARRGYHLSREYAVDPLEFLFVREVMRSEPESLRLGMSCAEALAQIAGTQSLFPVLDAESGLVGVVTRRSLAKADPAAPLPVRAPQVIAYPDEPLRCVADRMAASRRTTVPVVCPEAPEKLLGWLSWQDVLNGRAQNLEGEQRRERVFGWPLKNWR